jgi:hypothetical protein
MVLAGERAKASDLAALESVAWTPFLPTWTNLTVGAGGVGTYSYCKIGRLVVASYEFVLGTGSAVGTGPYVTLPVPASSNQLIAAVSEYRDSSASGVYWGVALQSGSVMLMCRMSAEARTAVTATTPFTWATGDSIRFTITYQSAS